MKAKIHNVVLDAKKRKQNYVGKKHTLNAKGGEIIEFTAKDSGFEVRFHNKDGFFKNRGKIVLLDIANTKTSAPLTIKSPIEKNTRIYYTAYCVENDDYADALDESPPKIMIE